MNLGIDFKMMLVDSGLIGWVTVVIGIVGLALVIERVKTLYFDFSIKSQEFMGQLKALVLNDQIEEAITFCTANYRKPMAHVIKGVLERSDRDDEGINQGLDIALAEVIPSLGKRLGYLAMMANVATLLGLLGTIQGLIMAFSAVSFADPSQKQIVLAQGISVAMYTTFIGLAVAIPIMVAYAFLNSKQNSLLSEISENSAKVVDWLTTRHYTPFNTVGVFPSSLGESELAKLKVQPPGTHQKVV